MSSSSLFATTLLVDYQIHTPTTGVILSISCGGWYKLEPIFFKANENYTEN